MGIVLNAIPLILNFVDEGKVFHNPISCFEWWFPGIIGAGVMVSNIYLAWFGEKAAYFTKLPNTIFQLDGGLCLGWGYRQEQWNGINGINSLASVKNENLSKFK